MKASCAPEAVVKLPVQTLQMQAARWGFKAMTSEYPEPFAYLQIGKVMVECKEKATYKIAQASDCTTTALRAPGKVPQP